MSNLNSYTRELIAKSATISDFYVQRYTITKVIQPRQHTKPITQDTILLDIYPSEKLSKVSLQIELCIGNGHFECIHVAQLGDELTVNSASDFWTIMLLIAEAFNIPQLEMARIMWDYSINCKVID